MSQLSNILRIKRVYAAPAENDGARVLVDRIWPRGLSKDQAAVELWLKAIAPTDALRRWFSHDPRRWNEFCQHYSVELNKNNSEVERLCQMVLAGPVTLLYAARDEQHNNALALFEYLKAVANG